MNDKWIDFRSLVKAHERLFHSKMNVHAKMHLIQQYKARNWTPTTLNGVKRDINGMEHELAANDAEKERLVARLRTQIINLVRLHVEEQLSQFSVERIERGRQRLAHLTQTADHVSDAILIAEILWILLQFDIERAKSRNDFKPIIDAYRAEALAVDRRVVSVWVLAQAVIYIWISEN